MSATATGIDLMGNLDQACAKTEAALLYVEDVEVNFNGDGMARDDVLEAIGRIAVARRNAQSTLEELAKLEARLLAEIA